MQDFNWKFLPLLLFFSFCKNSQTNEYQLVVSIKQASLRDEPSEKGREITSLQQGQGLTDLGEVSTAETQISVGDNRIQTPWIKVQTPENQTGWMLAWALRPTHAQDDWLLQKRMICYFGQNLAARRNAQLAAVANLETEAQFALAWRELFILRDTFLFLLNSRPETGFHPQYDWLAEVLPGFLLQKVGESSSPYLFADLGFWHHKSIKTSGLQDDAFIETCLLAFPEDSIESFFPAWKFQLSESESASQLGTGKHLQMMYQIDNALATGPLFITALETYMDQVLDDIFDNEVEYWQSQEKILEEVEQILKNPPKCLSVQVFEALKIRQKMFEDPIRNGIIVNLRSGK